VPDSYQEDLLDLLVDIEESSLDGGKPGGGQGTTKSTGSPIIFTDEEAGVITNAPQ
jgi:hypothetical protein